MALVANNFPIPLTFKQSLRLSRLLANQERIKTISIERWEDLLKAPTEITTRELGDIVDCMGYATLDELLI